MPIRAICGQIASLELRVRPGILTVFGVMEVRCIFPLGGHV